MEVTIPRYPDQDPEQDSMSHCRLHWWRLRASEKQALPKGPYWYPLAQETGTSGHSHLETLLCFTLAPNSPPARPALLIQSPEYPVRLLCPWGFSRQEYWSELPYSSPGDLPNPEIEPRSPALQVNSLPAELPGNLATLLHQN